MVLAVCVCARVFNTYIYEHIFVCAMLKCVLALYSCNFYNRRSQSLEEEKTEKFEYLEA